MDERARILVVDDDPGMRRAMERILQPLYDVESADGAARALERIGHDGGFQVALVDIRLGDGDGYVPGEAVGAVVLKPLDRAVADNDRIYGVIKGSFTNHAGKTAGYGVPSPGAQADLIAAALRRTGIDPGTIGYIEVAANGSSMGDAIELAGLTQAFRRFTARKHFCAVGSVKSNIGHPEAAAILMKLQGASTPRPMTHDLMADLLDNIDARCERISVTELRDNTFYATITLTVDGSEVEIDSRPSDALALAVRCDAPIYAAEEVIEESSIEFEHEVEDQEEVVEKFKDFLDEVTPEDFAGGADEPPREPD